MKVQVNLVEEVGQSAFKSWLSSLRLNKIETIYCIYLYHLVFK